MARIKYDTALIQAIALFEKVTGTTVRDLIVDRTTALVFVVEQHEAGQAIGRGGSTLRRLQELLKRKIKIVEFDPDITQFVRNLLYPLRVKAVRLDGDAVVIKGTDRENRALVIGKDRQNLRQYEEIVRRHFAISELKVV